MRSAGNRAILPPTATRLTEITFLDIQLPALLGKLARHAAARSQAVSASATSDPVTSAKGSTCGHLEDPSEATAPCQRAPENTIATKSAASALRIRPPIQIEVSDAILYLLIYQAGAEIRQAAGTTVTKAIQEPVAPVTLAIRVVLRTGGTPRPLWIHSTLGHRLCLVWGWTRLVTLRGRSALFGERCLGNRRARVHTTLRLII
jgi:hypothetical protein